MHTAQPRAPIPDNWLNHTQVKKQEIIDLTTDCTAPIVHESWRHGKRPQLRRAWVSRNGKKVNPKQSLQQEVFGAVQTIERPQSSTGQSPDKPTFCRSRLHNTRMENNVVDSNDQASRNRKKRKRQQQSLSSYISRRTRLPQPLAVESTTASRPRRVNRMGGESAKKKRKKKRKKKPKKKPKKKRQHASCSVSNTPGRLTSQLLEVRMPLANYVVLHLRAHTHAKFRDE